MKQAVVSLMQPATEVTTHMARVTLLYVTFPQETIHINVRNCEWAHLVSWIIGTRHGKWVMNLLCL